MIMLKMVGGYVKNKDDVENRTMLFSSSIVSVLIADTVLSDNTHKNNTFITLLQKLKIPPLPSLDEPIILLTSSRANAMYCARVSFEISAAEEHYFF